MSEENIITVQIPVKVDDGFISDIVCTMLEGGSNYWIATIKVNHPNGMKTKSTPLSTWAADALNKGGSLMIFPQDSDGEVLTINRANIVTGLKMWVGNHPESVSVIYEDGENHIDAGDIDADDADAILQYGTFGELVFG